MRTAVVVLLGLLLYLVAPAAKSQTWVICDMCQTDWDFEQAALSQTPSVENSSFVFAVGNPNTKIFRYVEVTTYHRDGGGEVPLVVNPELMAAQSTAWTAAPAESSSEFDTSIRFSIVSIAANAQEQQMFASNVKFALEDAVAPPPPDQYGFDSFLGADMIAVSNYLWAFKTALDPNWQFANVSLLDVLKQKRGQGPTVCIVYRNGDSGCYQLNPMDKNAARYINNTAKTLTGVPIDGSQATGGGIGDGDPLQTVQAGPSQYRWSNGSGSTGWLWLICQTAGGQLLSCYYIVIPIE